MILSPGAQRPRPRARANLAARAAALLLGSCPAALLAQPQEEAAPGPLSSGALSSGALSSGPLAAGAIAPADDRASEGEGSVFEGDFLSAGIGLGMSPTYIGSDDYQLVPFPVFQGSLAGIAINPRPAGFALDLIPDQDRRISFQAGPAARLNLNRAVDTRDDRVEAFPRLDTAVAIGPTLGIKVDRVLHSYDSVTLSADILRDVAGAHEGISVRTSATYFTPVSRGAAVTLSANATWIDDRIADYYYTVDPALAPGTPLPAFKAAGGFQSAGVTSLVFVDLGGDFTDGGLALFGVVNYARVLGDAAASPFTSVAGSADQFFGGVGVGYTF